MKSQIIGVPPTSNKRTFFQTKLKRGIRRYCAPPTDKKRVLFHSLTTVFILLFASLLCRILYRIEHGEQNVNVVMVLAVFMVAAFTDGYLYGLVAALSGVFLYDYLVTPPRFGFSFTRGFPVTLAIMLLVTLTTSTITARMKKQTKRARYQEQRAEMLYDINRKLLACRDEASIARYAMDYLKDDLRRSIALYTSLDDAEHPSCYFRQAEGDITSDYFISRTGWHNAILAAQKKQPQTDAVAFYIPIIAQETVYGVFGISRLSGDIPPSKQAFLNLMVEQTAQALRVHSLAVHKQQALVMAETEKARNSFLRGISHDLRTPLTSIIGASATILENREELPVSTQMELVEGIHSDSQWLLSMVENVLSVTKIHKNMKIQKTEEVAEEVVGNAVAQFRRRYPKVQIRIVASDEVLLVPMDPILITQVLNNLFENAYRHGGGSRTQIEVEMSSKDGMALFSVTDNGPGIPAGRLPHLFDAQYTPSKKREDSFRGLGIGLSLCKAIVEAHGGWIEAYNMPKGGARFLFGLPLTTAKEEADG